MNQQGSTSHRGGRSAVAMYLRLCAASQRRRVSLTLGWCWIDSASASEVWRSCRCRDWHRLDTTWTRCCRNPTRRPQLSPSSFQDSTQTWSRFQTSRFTCDQFGCKLLVAIDSEFQNHARYRFQDFANCHLKLLCYLIRIWANALFSDRSSLEICCFATDSIRNMQICSYALF